MERKVVIEIYIIWFDMFDILIQIWTVECAFFQLYIQRPIYTSSLDAQFRVCDYTSDGSICHHHLCNDIRLAMIWISDLFRFFITFIFTYEWSLKLIWKYWNPCYFSCLDECGSYLICATLVENLELGHLIHSMYTWFFSKYMKTSNFIVYFI